MRGETDRLSQSLLLRLDHGVDGGDASDRFLAGREIAQLFGDAGCGLNQAGRPLPRSYIPNCRPFPGTRFGGNDDFQPFALGDSVVSREGQKGGGRCGDIDEGAAQAGVHLDDTPHRAGAEPGLQRLILAVD